MDNSVKELLLRKLYEARTRLLQRHLTPEAVQDDLGHYHQVLDQLCEFENKASVPTHLGEDARRRTVFRDSV